MYGSRMEGCTVFRVWKIRWRRLFAAAAAVILTGSATAAVFAAQQKSTAAPAAEVVSSVSDEEIKLPIIMYHSLLKDSAYHGKYVISPDLLEQDLQYLSQNGYTPVHMAQVIAYVQEGTPLPEKPVILSFDDGYYNNYLYAYPLAQKYRMKLIIAPIGYYTDLYSETEDNHANYSHITWDQIREMSESGLVEFQNHTYNLHEYGARKGAGKQKGESFEAYEALLREDILPMQEKLLACTGKTPDTMVFPFGDYCADSLKIIRSFGFQAAFTCNEQMNVLTRDPECLFTLGRFLRPSGIDSETYFTKRVGLS